MADRVTLRALSFLAAAVLLQPGTLLAAPGSASAPAPIQASPSSSASKQTYPAPGKPGECKRDADCGPGFGCFAGGRCLCKPGRRLCKTTCADLQSDAENCGVCGHVCPAGEACVEGGCRAPGAISPLRISPLATLSSPFTLSYADGTSVCLHDSQAAPERAAVAGTARLFVAYGDDENNAANLYDTWGTTEHHTPAAYNSGWTTSIIGPNASATTSDYAGLDYVGYRARRSVDSSDCFAIAAADSGDTADGGGIATNTFRYDGGAACITAGDYVTFPTMVHDLGGTDLWVADAHGSPETAYEQIMEDCRPGQPGCCTNDPSNPSCTLECSADAAHPCPVTWNSELAGGVSNYNVHDEPTLAVNPCTHNAIMAYATTDNHIRLNVREPDGTLVSDVAVGYGVEHNGNDVCCNGQVRTCNDGEHYCDSNICSGEPCKKLAAHPEIVISEVSGTCYAYVSYDASITSDLDGHTYFTAYLVIYNVTDDSNPTWAKAWYSKDPYETAYNTYGHEVAAAGPYVAWGFYSDHVGPCSTYFKAFVDKSSMLSSVGPLYTLAGPFPSMRVAQSRLGWVRGISRGVGPGGQLLLTWAQPVCMDSGRSCDTCGNLYDQIDGCVSDQWSHVVKGTVITP